MKHFDLNPNCSASVKNNNTENRFKSPMGKAIFAIATSLVSILLYSGVSAQPAISSVSPIISAPGSAVTITGTNFNGTAANNIVYFGATQATVNSASATSLNVTVPYGSTYAPVTVNNTATALTAFSQYSFLPDFNNSAYIPGSIGFGGGIDFTDITNAYLGQVVVADIDGDGKPDLVVVGTKISVYRNISSGGAITAGSFAAPVDFAGTANGYQSVAVGDIDGDGVPDLVVAGYYYSTVDYNYYDSIYVFRNTSTTGSISFAVPAVFYENSFYGFSPLGSGVAIMDLDGDGKADVIAANQGAFISVFQNTATPGSITTSSLAAPLYFPGGIALNGVAAGDLDGDGKPDIAAIDGVSDVWVFRNTSTPGVINFATSVGFAADSGADLDGIVISDIDGDGKPDLAVAGYYDSSLSIFRNTATAGSIDAGSFAAPMIFTTPNAALNLAVGDFDGDGKPDLAVVCLVAISSSGVVPQDVSVSVYRNTAVPGTINSSSFQPRLCPTGHSLINVAVGDLNGDGKPEIITVANDVNNITVLQNDPLLPPPTITSVSPMVDSPGIAITITGTGFNTIAVDDVVYFGATQATVNSASATSLNVTVPTGATYAHISVDNTLHGLMAFSQYSFLPDYNNSPYMPGSMNFDGKINFTDAGSSMFNQVIIQDINGDGKPDMIVAGTVISIYVNTSTSGTINSGSFAAPIDIAIPGGGTAVAAGDIDGDGKPDLAICPANVDSIYIYRNTSSGGAVSFAPPVSFLDSSFNYASGAPTSIVIVDMDGDGKADIVTCSGGLYGVEVLRNTATPGIINSGSFASPVEDNAAEFGGGNNMVVTDLDGDGKPDIAISTNSYQGVLVIQNISTPGAINFGPGVYFNTGSSASGNTYDVIAVDIDGDGKPDLAAVNFDDTSIAVLRNTSTLGTINASSFSAPVRFVTRQYPIGITTGDFDGDGKPDLAVITAGDGSADDEISQAVILFRNTSVPGTIDATSLTSQTYPTENSSESSFITSGDLDRDGKTDLVVLNYNPSSLSVFRNDPLYPPPTITNVSTYIDSDGTSVTITGTNFNVNAANDIVYFGAVQATVNAASATSLTVTVPPAASYMPVTVNNTLHGLTAFSPKSFLPDFNNSAYLPGTVNFDPQVSFADTSSTSYPFILLTDVDGDGKPDIIAAGSNILVYRNISTSGSITSGSFAAPVAFNLPGGYTIIMAMGDIDGDGKPDIVISAPGNTDEGFIYALHNISTPGIISFEPAVTFVENYDVSPVGIAIIDIDGDGKADVVTADDFGLSVFQNKAAPGHIDSNSLAAPIFFDLAAGTLNYLSMNDIDGDGKPDAVATDNLNNVVWVYRNTSTPGDFTYAFAPPVYFSTGSQPYGVVTADIDGDGKPDVATVNNGDNTISLLRNTSTPGTISLASQVVYTVTSVGHSIAASDFDGDGKPDLAVANLDSNTIAVFRNTATPGIINTGSLAGEKDFVTEGNATNNIAGDVDGDGKADMINVNGDGSISILRNDPLLLSTILGDSSVCVGDTITLSDAATGGTWSSGNTAIATVGSTGKVTGVGGGTVIISYVTGAITATIRVTVNPLPNAGTINGTATVCIGSVINMSDTASGGVWSSGNTNVSVDGSGNVTGGISGTATISYTVTNGCGIVSATKTVTVIALPDAGTITGTANVCVGSMISLTDAASGGVWSSGTTGIATVGTNGVVTGIAGGSVVISYTVTNGCGSASATDLVTVNAIPVAGTISGLSTVCAGSAITLVDFTGGGVWSSGSTGIATVGSGGMVTGVAGGIVSISYTVTNSCGSASATHIVTVSAMPNAGSINGAGTVCVGATIHLSDVATGGVWSCGSTGIAGVGSTGVVTGAASGAAVISYTVTNSCGSATATDVVTVNTVPAVGPINGGDALCPGTTVSLSDALAGGVWSSTAPDVATIGTSGIVTGVGGGITIISYTISNGCGIAYATTIVTVNAAWGGIINGSASVNVGMSTTLTDVTIGGVWSVSNADATVSGGVVMGASVGTVTISYGVTGICGTAYSTKVMTVNAAVVDGINGNTVLCAGATTILSDLTLGGIWTSSNGAVATVMSSTGIVTGVNAGVATISYTVGSDYATVTITVNSNPTPILGATAECAGRTITLSDATGSGTWSGTGDATLSGSGSSATLTAGGVGGSATVTYTIATGCYVKETNTIYANPLPISGVFNVCVGGITDLTDSSPMLNWSSSNTAIAVASGPDITGESIGTAIITFTSSSPGGCIATAVVSVSAQPAAITGNTGVLCPGATLSLTDGSGMWTSSNAAIAAVGSANGVVTGESGGTATITFSESGASGCVAKTIVTVSAVPTISGAATMCIGGTTTLLDAVMGGTWSSGSTGIATVSAGGVVTGVSDGSAVITYTTAGGCRGMLTVTVNGGSVAISGNLFICEGATTTLSDASAGGTWSMGSSVASVVGSTGVVTASATLSGTATVSYTLGSCSATAVLTVNAKPNAISGATSECAGVTITLSDATAGGTWSGAGDAIISGTGATATLIANGISGTAMVTYTLSTGCAATMINTIYSVQPITGNFNMCVGLVTDLSDASSPGTWTSSSTAIAIASGADISGEGVGTATISFRSSAAGTCLATQVVTVNAMPVVTPVNGLAIISHAGSPVSISDATAGGIWSSSNTGVITLSGSTGSPIGATAVTTTGSSVVTYAVTILGCTTKVTKTFSAAASAHLTGTATVFAGATVSVADEDAGGRWSSSDNSIATVDGDGLVTGVMPGIVIITHETTGSDGAVSRTINVSVSALPAIINVLPNPNKGTFTVKGTLGSVADEAVTLEVTDLLGQVIYRNKVMAYGGKLNETIMLSNTLANGMYILNVQSGMENKTFHFVMEQ